MQRFHECQVGPMHDGPIILLLKLYCHLRLFKNVSLGILLTSSWLIYQQRRWLFCSFNATSNPSAKSPFKRDDLSTGCQRTGLSAKRQLPSHIAGMLLTRVRDMTVGCPVERSTSWNDLHNSLSDSSGMVPKCLKTLRDHTQTVGTLRDHFNGPEVSWYWSLLVRKCLVTLGFRLGLGLGSVLELGLWLGYV